MHDQVAYRYRDVSLVLTDHQGRVAGVLPPVRTSTPWLQEVREIVSLVKSQFDHDVTILRLLDVDKSAPPAIRVTMLAEAGSDVTGLAPWSGELSVANHRLPYAEPGGPDRDIDWAAAEIAGAGYGQVTGRVQFRTWNLSSIWRLSTAKDRFWLKVVPPFFAHEGKILTMFRNEKVPKLLAANSNRVLMYDLPGEDCYDADLSLIRQMIEVLVTLQWDWRDGVADILATGAPDFRSPALTVFIGSALEKSLPDLSPEDRDLLKDFVADMPGRMAELESCGLPYSLVHGDYHPGNWRGGDRETAILDWGDCGVGHPLLDMPALLAVIEQDEAPGIIAHWRDCWRQHLPNADVERALALVRPVAAARQAAIYRKFLDNIETAEHVYHATDPAEWFGNTARILKESH